jgi:chemotaxis protein MotB
MAKPGNGTIIIKKIKKGGHGGHHGGAWKVAYADFVTAMMAFFLLLWLLNVTTDAQKRGIADYFDPTISIKSTSSGSGGILGGAAIGRPGTMSVNATKPAVALPVPALMQPDDGEEGEQAGNPSDADKNDADKDQNPSETAKPTEKQLEKQLAAKEEQQFAAAEFALRQAIQDVPELQNLAENLIIDRTPEGLRIQLVDQDKNSMFPLGSAEMGEPAKNLMAQVAQIVQKLPNKISLTGNTDANPYQQGKNYTNWELSTDRANASRRALLQSGLTTDRIAKVIGMADRDPLFPKEPLSPRNRRISIVLLREVPLAGTANPKKLAQR